MVLEIDITEALFPLEESENRAREMALWYQAEREAIELVGIKSPIKTLEKIKEIYYSYETGSKREYVI